MKRTITAYTGVLVASLALAYLSWTREEPIAEAKDVVILAADAKSITQVAYKSDKMDLVMTRKSDTKGSYQWVELTKQRAASTPSKKVPDAKPKTKTDPHGHPAQDPPPAQPDAAQPDAVQPDTSGDAPPKAPTEPEAPAEPLRRAFTGGVSAETVIAGLSPMRARRVFVDVDAARLADFGLSSDAAVLTVEREGREPARFDVGHHLFGGRTTYMRDQSDGRVFLIEAKLIRILIDGDQRLVERRLLHAEPKDIVAIRVSANGREARFAQRNADDTQAAHWTRDGEDERHEAIDTWIKKALRLRATEFLDPTISETQGQPRFAIIAESRDGETSRVEVRERTLEGADPGETQWRAASDFSHGTAKIREHTASDLASNATTLFGPTDAP